MPPVLVVWRTSARGLGNVNALLFGATIVLALVPAGVPVARRVPEPPLGSFYLGSSVRDLPVQMACVQAMPLPPLGRSTS